MFVKWVKIFSSKTTAKGLCNSFGQQNKLLLINDQTVPKEPSFCCKPRDSETVPPSHSRCFIPVNG